MTKDNGSKNPAEWYVKPTDIGMGDTVQFEDCEDTFFFVVDKVHFDSKNRVYTYSGFTQNEQCERKAVRVRAEGGHEFVRVFLKAGGRG